MKKVFSEVTISVTYRRGKCLNEVISPSLYLRTVRVYVSRVNKCNGSRCDIFKNCIVFKNEFTCTATAKTYKVRGNLTCKKDCIVYLISCKKCKQQYAGSDFESNFKSRFWAHKSDINTGITNNCTGINKVENVDVQLIEEVNIGNYNLEGKLWSTEKYWQAQLFTLTRGMNSTWDWFSINRKGYRKKKKWQHSTTCIEDVWYCMYIFKGSTCMSWIHPVQVPRWPSKSAPRIRTKLKYFSGEI